MIGERVDEPGLRQLGARHVGPCRREPPPRIRSASRAHGARSNTLGTSRHVSGLVSPSWNIRRPSCTDAFRDDSAALIFRASLSSCAARFRSPRCCAAFAASATASKSASPTLTLLTCGSLAIPRRDFVAVRTPLARRFCGGRFSLRRLPYFVTAFELEAPLLHIQRGSVDAHHATRENAHDNAHDGAHGHARTAGHSPPPRWVR